MGKKGFTLIELLIVIVILGILVAIAVPSFTNILNNARKDTFAVNVNTAIRAVEMDRSIRNSNKSVYTLAEINNLLEKKLEDTPYGTSLSAYSRIIIDTEGNFNVCFDDGNNVLYKEDAKIVAGNDVFRVDSNHTLCGEISVEPNVPELTTGLIPVMYSAGKLYVADSSNLITCWDSENGWRTGSDNCGNTGVYWYDYNNSIWANAVTVTNYDDYKNATVGTRIETSDINTMWVWIPRYKYKLFNTAGSEINAETIDVMFELGNTSTGDGTITLTHPAFTFGGNELTGIWVGKYEIAYDVNAKVAILNNVSCLTSQTVTGMFDKIRQMEINGNPYGFASSATIYSPSTGLFENDYNNIDTHLIKNIEWGAVSYLSHSIYGKSGEVNINNTNPSITGGTPLDIIGKPTVGDMNTTTTGNEYGIYDMSGGQWDYVMATTSTPTYNTKYYDKYNSTSPNVINDKILGDATAETCHWHGDAYSNWFDNSNEWLMRGGLNSGSSTAGLFAFFSKSENYPNASTHAVLTVIKQ